MARLEALRTVGAKAPRWERGDRRCSRAGGDRAALVRALRCAALPASAAATRHVAALHDDRALGGGSGSCGTTWSASYQSSASRRATGIFFWPRRTAKPSRSQTSAGRVLASTSPIRVARKARCSFGSRAFAAASAALAPERFFSRGDRPVMTRPCSAAISARVIR
jgi:hypothetical protein